jgi:MFS family permease
MFIIHGVVNVFGVFFNPLQEYFQASRQAISTASTLSFMVMGASAMPMGMLADRWGPRRVFTLGTVVFALGYLLMSRATAIWQMYLLFIIIGIGFSPSDVVPLSIVVRWFNKRRGMMSGITKVGTGLGITVMPIVASILIEAYGWRTAFAVLSVMVIAIVIPLIQLLKRDPRNMGLLPDGEKQLNLNEPPAAEKGLVFRQALRTPQLWLVCGLFAAILYCSQSVLVHIVPYARGLRISETVAAGLVSAFGASSIAGRLIMGFASDKIGYQKGMFIVFLFLVIALGILQIAGGLWFLYLFVVIYGFNHGGFFAQISPLIAGLFGTRSQGMLLGMVIFAGNLFGSVSPLVTGRIYDVTNSYRLAFIILLLIGVLGLIFTTLLKPIKQEVGYDA